MSKHNSFLGQEVTYNAEDGSLIPFHGEAVGHGLIKARWTDEEELFSRIDPQVAHYAAQAELTSSIQEGLEARRSGHADKAAEKLGHAVQLATKSGHDETLQLLSRVVEIDDTDMKTVRLRPQVDDLDEMTLDTRSSRSIRSANSFAEDEPR